MRTTWIILLFTVATGAALYLIFNRRSGNSLADAGGHTPDSIQHRTWLLVASDPTSLYYHDSAWFTADSTPLTRIPLDSALPITHNRQSPTTYILDYDHRYFYDVELPASPAGKPGSIQFHIRPVNDTLQVTGSLYTGNTLDIRFNGPMLNMYRSFMVTYNSKLPPDTSGVDSTEKSALAGASKTITVL
ncbi:MAG: hypothetical protein P0Y53_08945 [Candidatus Pseudobacter hemicellulosilyticus]|uniref:Uncharacterized protein n=1 Tax=Candidatus Pseudobacter hemicellulosilyticus TaxID=3121375 RepID=A0AAJ5WW20_9BACT|nr:MAG: hypothetical protein P0Y53_08945 [Pseudobacter sp.]